MIARVSHLPNPQIKMPASRMRQSLGGQSWLVIALGFAFCVLSQANAQSATDYGVRHPQNSQMAVSPTVASSGPFQQRRLKELNFERQKEMVSETNDLLKLTAELNAEVAKNHSTSLTADQVHMLTRIEKLAKSVRDKMTNPVQGTIFENDFPPPIVPPPMQ
jgi:hypothetical protein